jgi:hypothetical protein
MLIAVAIMLGCQDREAARRESAKATATAEQIASGETLTSATVERWQGDADGGRDPLSAAFRLEQADYRLRLQRALDRLDAELAHGKEPRDEVWLEELRERRSLLKADLEAVDRSTHQDWATLRTKVDQDLGRTPRQ